MLIMGKEIYIVISHPDEFHYCFHNLNNARDCAWEMYKDGVEDGWILDNTDELEKAYFQLMTFNSIPEVVTIETSYYEDNE